VRRSALAVVPVVVTALALPSTASAHLHSGLAATDYLARAAPLGTLRRALSLSIYKTDRAVRLTVRPGHDVTVVGYLGEPFIRIADGGGVFVNDSSPTAGAAGLLKHPEQTSGSPRWAVESSHRTVVWHTAGLKGLPPGLNRARWRVPLIVDGQRTALTGEIWRVPAPSLWPWLLLATPFALAVALLLLLRRQRLLKSAVLVLGALAAAAAVAAAATFALAGNATEGRWVEGANELALALVGVIVLLRGSPNARALAAGGLGLLALTVGLSRLPVLLHGVVLSALPATPTRAAVAAAIWVGAASAAIGLVVFFEILEEPEPLPAPDDRPRTWERVLD
jgi:hypothetical protein